MNELTTVRKLLGLGDRQGAMRMLAGVIQRNPANLEAWLLLAQAVEEAEKKADCYRQVLKLDPGNPLATQGQVLLRAARMTGVIPPTPPAPTPTPAIPEQKPPEPPPTAAAPEEALPLLEQISTEPLPEPTETEPFPLEPVLALPDFELPSDQLLEQAEPDLDLSEPLAELLQGPAGAEISDEFPDLPDIIFQPSGGLPGALPRYGQAEPSPVTPTPQPKPQTSSLPTEEEKLKNFRPSDLFAENATETTPGLENKPAKKRLPLLLRILISLVILGTLGAAIFYGASLLTSALPTPTPLPALPAEPVATITLRPSWTPLPTETPYPTLTPIPTNTPMGGSAPAGLKVAFAAGNELLLWQSGIAAPVAVVDNTIIQVGISPDAQSVAFIRDNSLWVAYSDNQPISLLVSPSTLPADSLPRGVSRMSVRSFAWLPGTSTLLFNTTLEISGSPSQPANDLWAVDVASGEVAHLLAPGEGGQIFPAPNGSQVALVTTSTVSFATANGANRRTLLTFDEVITESGEPFFPVPLWARDSSHLVVIIPPPDALNDLTAPSVIWQVPAAGSDAEMLGTFMTLGGPILIAPDLNHVLYVLYLDSALPGGELHLASLDSADDTILLEGLPVRLLAWAPDSNGFAYFHAAGSMIYVNDLASFNETSFFDLPEEMQPALVFRWVTDQAALIAAGSNQPSALYLAQRDLAPITLIENAADPVLFDWQTAPAIVE